LCDGDCSDDGLCIGLIDDGEDVFAEIAIEGEANAGCGEKNEWMRKRKNRESRGRHFKI
jgi:hypothetical protein